MQAARSAAFRPTMRLGPTPLPHERRTLPSSLGSPMTNPHFPEVPPPVAVGEPPAAATRTRLARVRPEYASLYDGLDAGAWYPAASLADFFRSWLVRHPKRTSGAPLQGLDTAHFEFLGGIPRDPPWLAGQSAEERAGPRAS